MATDSLQSLRPRDTSAAGIASSIERMNSALIEMKGEMAAIQGTRRTVLLTGSNSDLDKMDGRVRALGLDIERIEAAVEALRPDLSAARGQERLERIDALRIEAEEKAERFREFWYGRYSGLAAEIAAGIAIERTARHARRVFEQAATQAAQDADVQAAGGVPPSNLTEIPLGYIGTNAMKSPALLVCLPAVESGPAIAWPQGHALAPIRPANEATVYA
jgi:hypothetical protein